MLLHCFNMFYFVISLRIKKHALLSIYPIVFYVKTIFSLQKKNQRSVVKFFSYSLALFHPYLTLKLLITHYRLNKVYIHNVLR